MDSREAQVQQEPTEIVSILEALEQVLTRREALETEERLILVGQSR